MAWVNIILERRFSDVVKKYPRKGMTYIPGNQETSPIFSLDTLDTLPLNNIEVKDPINEACSADQLVRDFLRTDPENLLISERTDQQRSQTEGNRALELFVDRHELTKRFAEYLNDDPPPEKILVFHGDGGNGKSLLLKFLLNHCCKYLPAEIWQEQKDKPASEVVNFLQRVTDWECDLKFVPAVLLDFGRVDDDRSQDLFYGLLMLHRRLVRAANQQGYQLQFPLYEFTCACYLDKQGKLTNEYISKLFPSQELFVISGIVNLAKTILDSRAIAVGLAGVLPTLAASTLNAVAKTYGKDLTLYWRGRGLKQEDFEKIEQLDAENLVKALPDF